jgi:hypothetical protein
MLPIKLVGLLFVSVQSKHRNSLFRYRSGSCFGCFESELISKDTLDQTLVHVEED